MIKQEDQSYDIEKAKAVKNEMDLIKAKIEYSMSLTVIANMRNYC